MSVNNNLGIIGKYCGEIFVISKITTLRNALFIYDDQYISHKIVFESVDCADKVLENIWKYCSVGKRCFNFDFIDKKGSIRDGFVR